MPFLYFVLELFLSSRFKRVITRSLVTCLHSAVSINIYGLLCSTLFYHVAAHSEIKINDLIPFLVTIMSLRDDLEAAKLNNHVEELNGKRNKAGKQTSQISLCAIRA